MAECGRLESDYLVMNRIGGSNPPLSSIIFGFKGRVVIVKKDPVNILKKLVQERYQCAQAAIWTGSVSQNRGNGESDLDITVIVESVDFAYRQAFMYEDWPVDAFIYDESSLYSFFELARDNDKYAAVIRLIYEGQDILEPNEVSQNIKKMAKNIWHIGPIPWTQKKIDAARFFITDVMHDIQTPSTQEEQIASTMYLYEPLIQFYFRAQTKWSASGKALIRYLKEDNPLYAQQITKGYEQVMQTGECDILKEVVKEILNPYGGFLWDGFEDAVL